MPIYEYRCRKCGKKSEFITFRVSEPIPEICKHCSSESIQRVPSRVRVRLSEETRMERLAEKLSGRTNRFADFARRHSECPTAMEGGKLGEVKQGQLYPELDRALFQMAEGEISPIIETGIGFHILLCERIKPGKPIPLSKVEARIREILEQNRRRNCQKAWIARLSAPSFCAPVPPKSLSTRLLSQGD